MDSFDDDFLLGHRMKPFFLFIFTSIVLLISTVVVLPCFSVSGIGYLE